jgi:hypothetical protein
MPLAYLRQEYPNHIMHVLNGPEDVLAARHASGLLWLLRLAFGRAWLLAAAALRPALSSTARTQRYRGHLR